MDATCKAHGAHFVALVVPAPPEIARRKFDLTHAVVAALHVKGIDTLSLEDAFMRVPDPTKLIASDQHWSAEGTRVAASVVEPYVRALLGVTSPVRTDDE